MSTSYLQKMHEMSVNFSDSLGWKVGGQCISFKMGSNEPPLEQEGIFWVEMYQYDRSTWFLSVMCFCVMQDSVGYPTKYNVLTNVLTCSDSMKYKGVISVRKSILFIKTKYQ